MTIAFKAAVHDPGVASFRYRVETPVAALRARGHDVELFAPDRAETYRTVLFSKSYRPAEQALARAVKARGGQVMLDLCDNHFYNPDGLPRYRQARQDLLAMIALADRVIVSTPALGRVVRAEAGLAAEPAVVGDVAERIALPPRPAVPGKRLLWFGMHGSPNAPSGMTDLLGIAPALRRAAASTPFELVVASNDEHKFAQVAAEMRVPARYVAWTRDGFPALLAAADAVLIPLSDNPFVACKTHNRLTAALWPGVPVVADAIESYREFAPFAWLDDWEAGLDAVLNDPPAARRRAAGARDPIDRHWSIEQLVPRWEAALGLASAPAGTPPPAAAWTPAPVPPATRASLYQGAVDAPRDDRVTGWARIVARAAAPLAVTLDAGGGTVASAVADEPRPDLAAAGFRHSDCGFSLPVPAAWRDGTARTFSVVADGGHAIETLTARFTAAPPLASTPAPSPAPSTAARIKPPPSAPRPRIAEPSRSRDEIRLQSLLAGELEALNEAVDTVRRIAARIVLAAGDGGLGSDQAGDAPLVIGGANPDGER